LRAIHKTPTADEGQDPRTGDRLQAKSLPVSPVENISRNALLKFSGLSGDLRARAVEVFDPATGWVLVPSGPPN